MTHTPGPWEADEECGVCANNLLVASCSRVLTQLEWNVCDANARLIAAAPDLLAACKGMLKALTDDSVPMVDRINAAADAIAKATGAEGR